MVYLIWKNIGYAIVTFPRILFDRDRVLLANITGSLIFTVGDSEHIRKCCILANIYSRRSCPTGKYCIFTNMYGRRFCVFDIRKYYTPAKTVCLTVGGCVLLTNISHSLICMVGDFVIIRKY